MPLSALKLKPTDSCVGMVLRMGNSMGLAMGINMEKVGSTLSAIDLSHARQDIGLHRAPTNMLFF